ncbi:hypothetical protein N8I77_011121 [Diaporthe amygdali]|uniref:Uncharacterized protein n=1 Tax=Phomopsis amygdali TaxID=1214568 RepID=A0AAD9S4W1_PHOAM|nr:uncharacterized protein J7T55_004407 [Diaporthe amygdali]KAJ0109857.1 hypothetical protein J7T55_004407 [Diaporthe amygdali]KAK2599357.1 hypothetical protein N8I77_011121 [Diaporthe amygdali]
MAATSSAAFPLATSDPYTGGSDSTAGTANAGSDGSPDNDAGASGSSSGNFQISQGALIAIILIVVFVALLGIASGTLFYLAKKREWKVRETIRRSAKKVVTALTPRRSEFPKSVKQRPAKSRGVRVEDEIPPTPRLKPEDLEKGLAAKVDVKRKYFHRK